MPNDGLARLLFRSLIAAGWAIAPKTFITLGWVPDDAIHGAPGSDRCSVMGAACEGHLSLEPLNGHNPTPLC
ncbi:hypothetical protein QBC46DRAFT_399441 [Diplogelasinospora grovesii]|uniref:Uncharacterized protein n=1 Tax=Diplogelasinospora grovesii TaxID=303347 RepID=A0AAN6MY25_9PEZI|nr:hypothetical protein QBC46DRAFT_399441 [Diplogelasinospora grovesii]